LFRARDGFLCNIEKETRFKISRGKVKGGLWFREEKSARKRI